ncbi:MAG: hypothetical protein JW997_02860 [Actinobacteria bacterium]|nr:hypothetical protein [Actinomycetota bacterium]
MKLNKEERVLRLINRQEVDYLPSQITLADRTRDVEISKALGLSKPSELDDYLENHFYLTLTLEDKPLFFRDVVDVIEDLHKKGFANPDWENNVVYDNWGMGIRVGAGSFFCSFHPLQGKTTEHIAKFMPKELSRDSYMSKDLKEAVKYYTAPDINKPGNFSDWEKDLKEQSGHYLVWPSGYFGIYERSYAIMGWNEFMLNMAAEPQIVGKLMDKITDYKVEHAKKMVEMGFKIGHHGDDLGTQCGGFFSKETFTKVLYPRLKREWEVFTDAGLPMMLHCCGNLIEFIPQLIDIGLTVLEPVQPCMDLEFLKREYGKDLIFFGGINTQVLPYITPEETKKLTRDTIRILGKGGGHIIAPSQELMNDIPVENIRALVETIREERQRVLEL